MCMGGSPPALPAAGPPPPDPADVSIRNAKLQERRRQLGLQGMQSTFLTMLSADGGAGAGRTGGAAVAPVKTVLGG